MGNGIASWPSNSLLIPATTSVITITPSLSLPSGRNTADEKHCRQKDLQSMITFWKAYLAKIRIIFPCILASIWTVISHNNTRALARCTVSIPGCFWVIARGAIHPLFYLLVSEWLIVTGSCPASHSVRFEPQTHSRYNSCKLGQVGCLTRFHESHLCGALGREWTPSTWIVYVCVSVVR